jgi:hypothetical protein
MNASKHWLELRFERQPDFVSRKVAGELILVPLGRRPDEQPALYTLDEVGAFLWELLDGQRTGHDLVEQLLDEYEVSAAQAEADIGDFIAQLQEIKAIRPSTTLPA